MMKINSCNNLFKRRNKTEMVCIYALALKILCDPVKTITVKPLYVILATGSLMLMLSPVALSCENCFHNKIVVNLPFSSISRYSTRQIYICNYFKMVVYQQRKKTLEL